MNCWEGECKYKNNDICERDNSKCDYTKENGFDNCHCNKGKLLPNDSYSDFTLNCYNACKYYNVCEKT